MLRTSIDMSDAGELSESATPGTGNVLAITEEDYAKPTCEGQGSVQTWRITDELNAGRHDQARAARPVDDRAQRARRTRPGRSPATGNCSAHWFDEQRRADRPGLVRPGRALPRHLQPARHPAGRLLRDDGHVLGRVLRSRRPRRPSTRSTRPRASTCSTSTARGAAADDAGHRGRSAARARGSAPPAHAGASPARSRSSPALALGGGVIAAAVITSANAASRISSAAGSSGSGSLEHGRAGGDREDVGGRARERDHGDDRAELERAGGDEQADERPERG